MPEVPYVTPADPPERSDWRSRAACRDYDPDLWFPVGVGYNAAEWQRPKNICRRECPVLRECLSYAADTGEWEFGVFGGCDPSERRQFVRARAMQRAEVAAGPDVDLSPPARTAMAGEHRGMLPAGMKTSTKQELLRAGFVREGIPTSATYGRSRLKLTAAGRAFLDGQQVAAVVAS